MSLKDIDKKGAISWMAQNKVAANLLMLFLLVGGFLISKTTVQEVFPELTIDSVTVSVGYSGASPSEVEKGIILPIEDAIESVEGIKEITSTAQEGGGIVIAEARLGTDIQKLKDDVEAAIDKITSFPDDAEKAEVTIPSRKREVLNLIIYGNLDDISLREIAEKLRLELLEDQGISQVDLSGEKNLEMSIEISQVILNKYGLKLSDIAGKIKNASLDLPSGSIKTKEKEILIRLKERKDFAKEFAKIPILTSSNGNILYLSDIATIKDEFEDINFAMSYNGQNAISLEVFRVGSQTPVTVSDAVKAKVEEFKKELPKNVKVTIARDRSDMYKDRLELLLKNAFLGLILVFFLLGIFLEIKLAFWVTLGIPISFLGSFLIIPQLGVTINMISLFAFIVSLGIVVDDAIVVGENIYNYREQGHSFIKSAILGAREITTPVIFSVLTNMVAFSPLYFVPGVMGKVFKTIPCVVISVFAISLIESLLILPAHLSHNAKNENFIMRFIHKRQQNFSAYFKSFVENVYGPFLQLSLKFRYVSFTAALVLLIISFAYMKSGRMGFSLFPKVESDFAYVYAVLPYGSSLEASKKIQQKLLDAEKRVKEKLGGDKQVEGVYSYISENEIKTYAFMTENGIRPYPTARFIDEWRKEFKDVSGLESVRFMSNMGGPGSNDAELTLELKHHDDKILEVASKEIASKIAKFKITSDVDDGFAPGKEQVDFTLKKEAYLLGLTPSDIASQIRNSYYGSEVLRQLRGRNEIKIMVRLPKEERVSEHFLNKLQIITPKGTSVLLRNVVNITKKRAYVSINRRDGKKIINITADVNPPSQTPTIIKALKESVLPKIQQKYPSLGYSFEGKQAQEKESLNALKNGALLAFMLIYVLLAIPFKSYMHPVIIMVSIPFGIIGAIIGHLIMGYSLSLLSVFGIIALSGVVINDSLVLIDLTNRKRRTGSTPFSSIVNAGINRFRPILLTTLTTFCGLMPMIFEKSLQARFLIPMAISLGFGILFSTLIILILVPALYIILEDIKTFMMRVFS